MGFLDATGITTLVTKLKERFVLNSDMPSLLATKQDKLVSGKNIKTIGGYSLLGSGNVTVPPSENIGLVSGTTIATALEGSGSNRIWFTSADGTKLVPINTSTSGWSGTKTLNTTPINPFMQIYYCSSSVSAGSNINGSSLHIKGKVAFPYSYVKNLTETLPVFAKCAPKTDGSVVLSDIVQEFPATADGFVYIFLGMAYGAQYFDLSIDHPVYWHDGTGIRLWGGAALSQAKINTHIIVSNTQPTNQDAGDIWVITEEYPSGDNLAYGYTQAGTVDNAITGIAATSSDA